MVRLKETTMAARRLTTMMLGSVVSFSGFSNYKNTKKTGLPIDQQPRLEERVHAFEQANKI